MFCLALLAWLFAYAAATCGVAAPVTIETATSDTNAKPLYCAFGGIGMQPMHPPPGFESQFAVIVVEINSPREMSKIAVSDFVLLDKAGKATKFKRVVEIEVFDRPGVATEGISAYYENSGGTQPWTGTLPAGKIRLRIRVALTGDPIGSERFKLTFGPYVMEGPIDCVWPT